MSSHWQTFSSDQLRSIDLRFELRSEIRWCPNCGNRTLRNYSYNGTRAGHDTLVRYVWCSVCRHYWGTTGSVIPGYTFSDPLLPEKRISLERGGEDVLFGELDKLWERGELPQNWVSFKSDPS